MSCVYKVNHLIKDETEFGRVSTKAWHHISVQTFGNTLFRLEFANSYEANRGLVCQTSTQSGIQTRPKRQ